MYPDNDTANMLEALLEATSQIVWTSGADGGLFIESEHWREYTGNNDGTSPADSLHPDETASVEEAWETAVRDGSVFELEHRLRDRDGRWRWFQTRAIPVPGEAGRAGRWIGMSTDITQRKHAERDLREKSRRLRELTARTEFEVERERKRIATEVHDQLGGNLAVLKHDLMRISEKVSGRPRSKFERELLNDLYVTLELLENVIETAKEISAELYSSELEFLGLVSALKSEGQNFQKRHGIECEFESNVEDSKLGSDRESAVYWVFRELLRNILQHSGAAAVYVSVAENADTFVLTVEDDGRGITEEEQGSARSLGILGMRERIGRVGGRFTIGGRPGSGTVAAITFGLDERGTEDSAPDLQNDETDT